MGKTVPVIERFWAKVEKKSFGYKTECWVWVAYISPYGYGWFRGEDSKQPGGYKGRLAHRWAFEHFKEKIKEEYELDHLCRNKACVNPDHLVQVVHADNMRGLLKSLRIKKCKKGHEYTPENTFIRTRPDGRIYRMCRICKKDNEKNQYLRNIEEERRKSLERYHKKKHGTRTNIIRSSS